MTIYIPSDDSYLLAESIKQYLLKQKSNLKILDMGSGSGFLAETCRNLGFTDILTADINPEAVEHLNKKGFRSIKTDLFSKISKKKFDFIIFNPPYLPEDKLEPEDSKIATTAGKYGYEIIIEFLTQAKSHLNKNGIILLLFSSLSKPRIIIKKAKQLKYKIKLINKKKLFFEELYVYELKEQNKVKIYLTEEIFKLLK